MENYLINKNIATDDKHYKGGWVNYLCNQEDYISINNWYDLAAEELANELFSRRNERHNYHVLESLFESELLELRTFIKDKYQKTLITGSDVGAISINGLKLSNNAGDGSNSIYILDKKDLNFLPQSTQVAFAYDEVMLSSYDLGEADIKITADGLISIHRTGPKQFCIVGMNIEYTTN